MWRRATAFLTTLVLGAACASGESRRVAGGEVRRLVTLGPSFTEISWLLGAGDRLVGRSRWDRSPEAVQAIAEVGDAIRPNLERIVGARPDLVVLYPAGDNAPAIDALTRAGIPVLALRVDRIADYLHALDTLGTLLGARPRADSIRRALESTLDAVRQLPSPGRRPTVFVPVWMEPPMTVGAGSFISELLTLAGADNIYRHRQEPSFTVAFEDVLRRDADVILASPAARARLREAPPWTTLKAVREERWLTLDTLTMSQPSRHMGDAAAALAAEVRRIVP
ncbi:MAG: ABC transporter substrate-binding protein [Gemmatimonadetes bacterium]|nr:ABC transporter substrate-binding protein [Gemmatimonadota bacterium]